MLAVYYDFKSAVRVWPFLVASFLVVLFLVVVVVVVFLFVSVGVVVVLCCLLLGVIDEGVGWEVMHD